MLGLVCALKSESSVFLRQMNATTIHRHLSFLVVEGIYRGKPIILATTGMGRDRAEEATRSLLDRFDVSLVVSMGFAGALTDQLSIGDIVLGSVLHATRNGKADGGFCEPITLDEKTQWSATQALSHASVPLHVTEGVTVPDLVCDPAQRILLAKATGATYADMESYWIARIASERSIPFLIVRAISDTNERGLLPFTRMMMADGRWKAKETALYFIRRPHHIARLFQLAIRIPRVRRNLARSIHRIVDSQDKEQGE